MTGWARTVRGWGPNARRAADRIRAGEDEYTVLLSEAPWSLKPWLLIRPGSFTDLIANLVLFVLLLFAFYRLFFGAPTPAASDPFIAYLMLLWWEALSLVFRVAVAGLVEGRAEGFGEER